MLFLKISFHKVNFLFIIFLISFNFNSVWANNFISRGHYVEGSAGLAGLSDSASLGFDNVIPFSAEHGDGNALHKEHLLGWQHLPIWQLF